MRDARLKPDGIVDTIMGYRKAKVLLVAAHLDCFTRLERPATAAAAARALGVDGRGACGTGRGRARRRDTSTTDGRSDEAALETSIGRDSDPSGQRASSADSASTSTTSLLAWRQGVWQTGASRAASSRGRGSRPRNDGAGRTSSSHSATA